MIKMYTGSHQIQDFATQDFSVSAYLELMVALSIGFKNRCFHLTGET